MVRRDRSYNRIVALAAAALLVAAALSWAAPAAAQETPLLPDAFYGQVYLLEYGGQVLQESAVVAVYVGDEVTPRGQPRTVANGWYASQGDQYLVQPVYSADIGKPLVFKVNGVVARTYYNGAETTLRVHVNPATGVQEAYTARVDLVLPDTTPPKLTRVRPATLVGLPYRAADYTGDMVFTWEADEELDTRAAVTAVFAPQQGETVEGLVTYAADAKGLTVVPAADLAAGARYTLTVSGVKDRAGNRAANLVVEFSTYAIGPAPVVTGLKPATAVCGKPDQSVTVTGQNFQDGARVVLCREGQADTVVAAVYRSGTELGFTVPVDLAPGLYMVKVKNPDGQTSTEHVLLTLYAGEAPRAQAFPGATGSEPGEIRPDGAVRVEVPVQVAQAYPNALVVIRVDDPDGKPMLAAVEGPLPANTEVKFSASFNLPGKAGSYAVKAFVWDGWRTMSVLTPPYEGAFAAGDTTPPAVASTDPTDEAAGVPVDKVIRVIFNEPVVEGPQFGAISLARDGNPVAASCSLSGTVLSIRPGAALAFEARYTVTVPAGAVKDVAGNLLASAVTFSFTTAAAPDTTPPTVEGTDPANGATDVPVDKSVTVTFSEDVQAGPAYGQISVKDAAGNPVEVDKSISGRLLTLDPISDLAAGTAYTVTIPTGAVKDAAGNALAEPYTFGFTTKAVPAPSLELKVGTVSGAPGSTVQVPVVLTSRGEVGFVQFDVAFDTNLLTFQRATRGELTQDTDVWSVTGNFHEGVAKVMIYNTVAATIPAGSGTAAILTFQVAAGAQPGQSCDLALQNAKLVTPDEEELAGVNLVNGRFTVQ